MRLVSLLGQAPAECVYRYDVNAALERTGRCSRGAVEVRGVRLPLIASEGSDGPAVALVRPEAVSLSSAAETSTGPLVGTVIALAFLGGLAVPLYAAGWLLIPDEETDTSVAEELLARERARGAY